MVAQKSWFHLYLPAAFRLARGKRNPIVRWLDEELGVFNQHSREKRIPEMVFVQTKEKVALFLKHLWATDGCVFVSSKLKGPKVRLYYASNSRLLVEQVAHLLLRLGIISRISRSAKAGYGDISGGDSRKDRAGEVLKIVGGVGIRKARVERALGVLEKLEENPNLDVIPKDVWLDIGEARVNRGLSTREFHKRLGWAYSGTQRHNNGLSRGRLMKVAGVLPEKKLSDLAKSDLFGTRW